MVHNGNDPVTLLTLASLQHQGVYSKIFNPKISCRLDLMGQAMSRKTTKKRIRTQMG